MENEQIGSRYNPLINDDESSLEKADRLCLSEESKSEEHKDPTNVEEKQKIVNFEWGVDIEGAPKEQPIIEPAINELSQNLTTVAIQTLEQLCKAGIRITGFELNPENKLIVVCKDEYFLRLLSVMGNYKLEQTDKYLFEYYTMFKFRFFRFLVERIGGKCTITIENVVIITNLLEYLKSYNEKNACDTDNWVLVETK
jgi:hypothetical protein